MVRTLDIVKDSEVLSTLFNRDNVHESGRVAWLCSHLVVDLDQSLSSDSQDFSSSQGIL
jgi:hypothetical protein